MINKKRITVSCDMELEYDTDDEQFQTMHKEFKECMWDFDVPELLKYVARQIVARGGIDDMIEGVGYVGIRDDKFYSAEHPSRQPFSGIYVDEADIEFESY